MLPANPPDILVDVVAVGTVPVTAIVTLPVALDTEILLPATLLNTPVLVIIVPDTLIPVPPEYVPAPEN